MKVFGYVIAVFGGLSSLGALIGNGNPLGGIFVLGLGIFIISRVKQKAEREEAKKKWTENEK